MYAPHSTHISFQRASSPHRSLMTSCAQTPLFWQTLENAYIQRIRKFSLQLNIKNIHHVRVNFSIILIVPWSGGFWGEVQWEWPRFDFRDFGGLRQGRVGLVLEMAIFYIRRLSLVYTQPGLLRTPKHAYKFSARKLPSSQFQGAERHRHHFFGRTSKTPYIVQ